MITKNQIRLIKSLAIKKNRVKHRLFVVEGKKNIAELLSSDNQIDDLFATDLWIDEHPNINAVRVSATELQKISNYKSPNEVLAIVKIKDKKVNITSGLTLVLDDINDPGNMGTIIRICDWFGVKNIICSNNTVDIYNPKVVQSAMGSIFRVNVKYTHLLSFLKAVDLPIFGAFMDGENIKNVALPKDLYLVMGNEANGISKEIIQLIAKKLKIENIGGKTESLNVAVATSIFLHEICN